jgi:NADP-dependent 3-hydroxy acid dehydrogenase YdfG
LEETARLVERAGGEALVLPLDARDGDALAQARAAIVAAWTSVDDLVLSAGLNTPRRTWADQSMSEVQRVVDTNLTAVVRAVDAVLPDLRTAGGQVVVISSYAAWRFSPFAGVAYSASKSALRALCQTLNAQEAPHGVRACHLCPGDVDTEFLTLRPQVPGDDARSVMLRPDDVGRAVSFVLESPPWVRIDELVISPVSQT